MIYDDTNGFVCPFCGMVTPKTKSTRKSIFLKFGSEANNIATVTEEVMGITASSYPTLNNDPEMIRVFMFKCGNCYKVSSTVKLFGNEYINSNIKDEFIFPISKAKKFPEYIPQNIRNDYEEAYSILHLSPKASATLSRRALQGMIRDFWKVKHGNLNNEINQLKGKVTASTWDAIDALRGIGNIGAHMENDINKIIDIDEGEAEKLLKLIEYLLKDWYINQHDAEQLKSDIISIGNSKKEEKKN